jgi:purine-cytosine permease-like protein
MPLPAPLHPQPAPAAHELHEQATTWLVLSLLSSVLCVSLGLGVGGAVFCYLALQSAGQGLTADARAKLKWGKILTLVGSFIGVLATTLTLILR